MTEADTSSAIMAAEPVAKSIFLGVADEHEAIVWHNIYGDPEVVADVDRLVFEIRSTEGDDDPAAQHRNAAAQAAVRALFARAAIYATN